jgi:CheY-like chemotaxis protein
MVVDDDPVTLKLTRVRLEGAGYDVILREEAIGTANAIRQHLPDLVLLDVHMPGLSGDALARLIQQDPSLRACVALFSSADPELLEELVQKSGAIGWVRKTADTGEFLARIGLLLLKKANAAGKARLTPAFGILPIKNGGRPPE